MKKILTGAVLFSALILSGCTNDQGETVASTEAGKIYSTELYEAMKSRYGAQTLQAVLIEDILEHRYGDQVTEEDVDALLQENVDSAGGEEQFEMYLAAQGLTMDTLQDSTRLSLLIAEAVKEYDGLTEEKLKAHYEEWTPEVTTSHILVEDKEEAEDIIAQLDDGADFTEMVKEHSTDTASVKNDGRVTFAPGSDKVVKEYEDAALALEEGEYTKEPVESAFGYHIIYMNEKPEKGTYEEEKDQIEKDYVESLMTDQETIQNAVKRVAEESNIIIEDEELTGALSGILGGIGDSEESDSAAEDSESAEETNEEEAAEETSEEETTEK